MIQHVARAVPTDALELCVEFYRLVGFVEVPVPPALVGRARWLAMGPTQLHLLPRPGVDPEQGHFAVHVPAWEATLARLAEAGTPAVPREAHWGARRAGLRDPAGHLVELMERPPA